VTHGIEELTQNVKHSLRYLQKPFFKLQSLSRTSEVTIPLHELNKLEEYLNDPYMALATEQDGFPTLKSILTKLDTTISQGKLKLKSARIRKAQDQMNTILNKDSLLQLQRNCREALNQKEKLTTSEPVTALQNQLAQLQNQLRESRRESELANSKVKALRDEQTKLRERTEHLKKELEKSILQLTNKNVEVVHPVR
jgi:predicted RNase H-like nuclease (RuvC/YqgF family)